jgi:hypothetical protein
MEENDWTVAVYLSIDWISFGRTLKRLDKGRSTSTITFLHSWLPTSQQQHDIDEEKDVNLPNCAGHPKRKTTSYDVQTSS